MKSVEIDVENYLSNLNVAHLGDRKLLLTTMKGVFRTFHKHSETNKPYLGKLLRGVNMDLMRVELIVTCGMAANAYLGKSNAYRNEYCIRALEYFKDKGKSEAFLNIYR